MTRQESFQLQGNAPQIYEQHKVPAIFRPLAERTLQRVGVHEGARVIQLLLSLFQKPVLTLFFVSRACSSSLISWLPWKKCDE